MKVEGSELEWEPVALESEIGRYILRIEKMQSTPQWRWFVKKLDGEEIESRSDLYALCEDACHEAELWAEMNLR